MGKVFGIGLSRTGTKSLTAALEILGFSAVHFPTRTEQIEKYDAATDTPVANAFDKLDQRYPDSRFILTVRNRDDWLASCEAFWKKHETLFSTHPFIMTLHKTLYGGLDFRPDRFAQAYERHTEGVLRYFADRPRDLLVLDITGGGSPWQSLCSFLERPVPDDTPFPHENRSDLGGEGIARRLSVDPLIDESLDFPTATEQRTFYAICHTPRCGSHYLAREMWRTGCLGAPHEYFNVHIVMLQMSARLGARSLSEYADRLLRARTGPNGVFGLKTAFIHFMFLRNMSEQGPRFQPMKFIHIRRDDRIGQAVSHAVAAQTQQWTSGHQAIRKPVYSSAAVERSLRRIQHMEQGWERVFKRAGVEPYRVVYEDFCRRPAEIVGHIADYLGVELSPDMGIDNLPSIDRQSDPIKAEWVARFRAENPPSS